MVVEDAMVKSQKFRCCALKTAGSVVALGFVVSGRRDNIGPSDRVPSKSGQNAW